MTRRSVGTPVRHGQLWADKDWTKTHRKHLRVVGLDTFGPRESWSVHLNNEDTGVDTWVLRRRLLKRFRLVQDVDG